MEIRIEIGLIMNTEHYSRVNDVNVIELYLLRIYTLMIKLIFINNTVRIKFDE